MNHPCRLLEKPSLRRADPFRRIDRDPERKDRRPGRLSLLQPRLRRKVQSPWNDRAILPRGRVIPAIRLDGAKFDVVGADGEAVLADRVVRPVALEAAVRLPGMADHHKQSCVL